MEYQIFDFEIVGVSAEQAAHSDRHARLKSQLERPRLPGLFFFVFAFQIHLGRSIVISFRSSSMLFRAISKSGLTRRAVSHASIAAYISPAL